MHFDIHIPSSTSTSVSGAHGSCLVYAHCPACDVVKIKEDIGTLTRKDKMVVI